jgi:hypothetical protein
MQHNLIEGLRDLSEDDAEKVYKEAVILLKKHDPYIYLKTIMFAGAGGAAGVMCGVALKDMVLQLQGINMISLSIFAICGGIGGGLGGFLASKRLSKLLKPWILDVRKSLGHSV